MKKIKVALDRCSYDIIICSDGFRNLGKELAKLKLGIDAVIVTNPAIKALFGGKIQGILESSGFNLKFEIVPDTEKAKSAKYCIKLLNNIAKFDSGNKQVFIIALGGGVIGDLAGFTASIYKRGISYIQVPTTLLSQIDSSIGGKTAIDLDAGKNLAGSFYQPMLVYSDVSCLIKLPKSEIASGLAEAIKYGIIKSPSLFVYIENNLKKILNKDKDAVKYIVSACSRIKAGIVKKDELDTRDVRIILNLGHTIGHAIETSGNYFKYSHGQAIALGILAASFIAVKMQLLKEETSDRIRSLIKKAGLPVKLKAVAISKIISAYKHDKKFKYGKNRFVLPVKIGQAAVVEDIPQSLIIKAIKSLL